MIQNRPGKSVGAKLARALLVQVGSERAIDLEGKYEVATRHQLYRLTDGRLVDFFLKSARLYRSEEEYIADKTR